MRFAILISTEPTFALLRLSDLGQQRRCHIFCGDGLAIVDRISPIILIQGVNIEFVKLPHGLCGCGVLGRYLQRCDKSECSEEKCDKYGESHDLTSKLFFDIL